MCTTKGKMMRQKKLPYTHIAAMFLDLRFKHAIRCFSSRFVVFLLSRFGVLTHPTYPYPTLYHYQLPHQKLSACFEMHHLSPFQIVVADVSSSHLLLLPSPLHLLHDDV